MQTIRRVLICSAVALASVTAGANESAHGPNVAMYVSYAFDAPAAQNDAAGLRYGLRLDHDWRRQQLPGRQPALLEWQFRDTGFDHVTIAGTPIISPEMILRQEGEGGIGSFLADNLGSIVLVGGGALLVGGLVVANSEENSRDTDDVDDPPGAS